MVHGVRLRGGEAEWYRNRYVAATDGPSPNTNVGGFAGTTWAMVEAGTPPVEMGYELDSLGVNPFGGTLPNGFSAHPKYDPATGELHAMAYHWPDLMDHVQYVVVGGDGRVSKVVDVPVPDMPMIHDMSLTATYAVVYDLPVTVNFDVVVEGYPWPFAWAPDRAARVGLLPRSGTADDIVWCDVDPCYVFHPLNAYDADDGTVVVDLCRYDRMMDDDRTRPVRRLPPDVRSMGDRSVDSQGARDAPRRPAPGVPSAQPDRRAAAAPLRLHLRGHRRRTEPARRDHQARRRSGHDRGPRVRAGRGGAEPVVVPKADGVAEDDAWILTVVYDAATDASELHILDAR